MTPGGRGPGRTLSLGEADEAVLRRAGGVRLTAEDVILLLLRADPRPVRGEGAAAELVYLAATGPLAAAGVEPIAFRRGRGGRPRSGHVRLALENLAFSGLVEIGAGRRRAGSGIAITPRGRRRIAGKYGRLPAAARSALADARAGEGPACVMEGDAYVHNGKLLERLAPGSQDPGGPRRGATPSAGRAPAGRVVRGRAARPPKRAAPPGGGPAAAKSSEAASAPLPDAARARPPAVPVSLSSDGARDAPARGEKRRYPRILGFPSLVGVPTEPGKAGGRVDILTQFNLYRSEQLSQNDGIFAQNVIHRLLSDYVYPLILRASGEWPDPKDFGLYAIQILMHSREELNDVLVNEDVKLRVGCRLEREGAGPGDEVFVGDLKEIVSIGEVDRDPDAAAISLLRVRGQWFGKFDVIYNRNIAHQKLKRALRFLDDSTREDASLESRYNSLWSGCELLAESALLLHNMLKPKSTHKDIKKGLEQLLKNHDMSYIEGYAEIAQIRDSLRYGPPHPDRSDEAKRKMSRLLNESLEFAFFAIRFLEGRQVVIGSDDTHVTRISDPAGGPTA